MRSFSRRSVLAATTAAVAVALVPEAAAAAPPSPAATARDYEKDGPHQPVKAAGDGAHTLYYPADLASSTAKHPVLIWGNGTGATVDQYEVLFTHLASWGYVVAAANTGQSGSGEEMLAGAKYLIAENARSGSVFHERVATGEIAAAGHSQGGGGALAAGADPLVKTTIPIMPGPQGRVNALHGPAFFVSGQADIIVPAPYVRARFAACDQVPAVYGQLRGATHFLQGDTRYRLVGAVTAWLQYHLAGDQAAKSVFYGPSPGLRQDTAGWSDFVRNSRADGVQAGVRS
ncbi:poly(ethylene terephthalate) hydrolase family protein [Amycolatopsis orientalis]|uniref:poly(ethylene terephthalate) hydrolase family protein n=1 Tax=Amycolatopsis orientalis TaxID=31958 RepID=UPI0003AA613D|nr:alpha/beta hydrolase [Amycolatopsis orientalis]